MQYNKTVTLKDGRTCHLRNGTAADGADVLAVFHQTHAETDYLLTYPDENHMTEEQESTYLVEVTASPNAIEICAVVDGNVLGTAGFSPVGGAEKLRHRAEFGIAIREDSWGLGIGRALTEACIDRARQAGYAQLELDVVAENASAIALYQTCGFVEYGRNPKGFRSRTAGWQTLVLMRKEL